MPNENERVLAVPTVTKLGPTPSTYEVGFEGKR